MVTSNERKRELLGEPFGTAVSKLRKAILFKLAGLLNLDICYRCQNRIENIEEFSIEHIKSWQGSITPKETFYDLNNISFSHLYCNISHGKREYNISSFKRGHIPKNKKFVKDGYAWCGKCGEQIIEKFTKNISKSNGVQDLCKECRSKYRSP